MIFQFYIEEGVIQISVYKLISRTTAALEAYNRHLGSKIFSHANFFVLCQGLLDEESSKARDFGIIAKGGQLPSQRRAYRLRDETIRKLGKQLADDEIPVDTFLNGIVSNDICKDKCNFNMKFGQSDSDDDSDSDISNEPSSSQSGVVQSNTCMICYAAVSDILLNCGHYKYCLTCFETEKSFNEKKKIAFELGKLDREPLFKCPFCNTVITNHMHIPKIYH